MRGTGGAMAKNKDAKASPDEDFEAQWEEYWEEMGELNDGLEEQQSVTSKTLDLVFVV